MTTFVLILLVTSLATCNTARMNTFYGTERNSYARYNTWQSSSRGALTLTFKTTEPDGLLLYADDQYQMKGNGNFLKLKLFKERLVIQIQISFNNELMSFKSEGQIFILGSHLNDNRKHVVKIQRHNRLLTFNLDGEVTTYTPPNEMSSLNINSSVFVGGIPSNINAVWMDNSILTEKRFTGCIGKLSFHGNVGVFTSATFIEGNHIEKGCQDKCLSQPTLECENGGGCLNMYVKTGCDCRGTGFTGKTCQQPSKTLSFAKPGSFMVWTPRTVDFSRNRDIMLRFKSDRKSNGEVLLYATDGEQKEGHFSIELQKGTIVITASDKGELEDEIKINIIESNKPLWRFIHVFSNTRFFSLQLHDGFSQKSYRKEYRNPGVLKNSLSHLKKVYIGGGINKRNFTGCMQDVVVNQVDLVEMLEENGENMKVIGTISDFCNGTSDENNEPPSALGPIGISSLNVLHQNTENAQQQVLKVQGVTKTQRANENGAEQQSSKVWIIVASVASVGIVVIVVIITVRYLVYKRYKRIDQYTDHVLRRIEEEQPKGSTGCLREQQNQHAPVQVSGKQSSIATTAYTQSDCGSTLPRSMIKCIHHQSPNVLHHQHPFFEQDVFQHLSMAPAHAQNTSPCKRNRDIPREWSHCKRTQQA